MRKLCFSLLFLASVCHVFGQQSLTITASRAIPIQPDEVIFAIGVVSGPNTGLDDIVAGLSGSGVTAADFVGVNSVNSQPNPILQWEFNLAVPISKIKDALASFTALQTTLAQNKSGLNLTFNAVTAQVSPQLQASQPCPIFALIADARAQAQKMASSAGVSVGPILALSDAGATAAAIPFAVPVLASRIGDFSALPFLLITPLPFVPPLNCTIVVKFSVLTPQ